MGYARTYVRRGGPHRFTKRVSTRGPIRSSLKRKRAPLHPRHAPKYRRKGIIAARSRPRPYRDPNSYRQMETLSAKWGRRSTQKTFLNRLVKSSYNYVKYVMRCYNPDGNGVADGALRQTLGFESVGTQNYYPILCFDLSSVPQGYNGTQLTTPAAWRLQQNVSTGQMIWQLLGGQLNDDTTISNNSWQCYKAEGLSLAGNIPSVRRGLMEYLSMRFRIRGPTNRPTRVVVQIVQPYAYFQGMPQEYSLSSGAVNDEHMQVWINMAARNTRSPVQNIPSTTTRSPWKVIRTQTFELQPTSTTETDTTGHDVVQKWFWKCNKFMSYDYRGFSNTDNFIASDSVIGDATSTRNNTVNSAAPGKRYYMIIQAYCPNASNTLDPTIHPSMEYMFEKKIASLNGISTLD